MGWLRAIALSKRNPFPAPIRYESWELYPPHAVQPNDSLPENLALDPESNLPPQPPGPQAFAQPWTGKAVPGVVPPPISPFGT